MESTGKIELVPCVGDAQPFNDPDRTTVLRYGQTWKSGGIVCTEEPVGLTCRNRDHHGFFLSPGRWRVF